MNPHLSDLCATFYACLWAGDIKWIWGLPTHLYQSGIPSAAVQTLLLKPSQLWLCSDTQCPLMSRYTILLWRMKALCLSLVRPVFIAIRLLSKVARNLKYTAANFIILQGWQFNPVHVIHADVFLRKTFYLLIEHQSHLFEFGSYSSDTMWFSVRPATFYQVVFSWEHSRAVKIPVILLQRHLLFHIRVGQSGRLSLWQHQKRLCFGAA